MRSTTSHPSGRRWGPMMKVGGAVLALFLLFVVAVKWFRSAPVEEESVVNSIANVLKPDPISEAVIEGGIDRESPEARLRWLTTGELMGVATRGEKDERYYIEIVSRLPEIDREVYYYQVWLLSRLPYTFFSLGEMVTNEEGEFIFEWEAPDDEDYSHYTEVVITVNAFEGSSDPERKLVEGVFGE